MLGTILAVLTIGLVGLGGYLVGRRFAPGRVTSSTKAPAASESGAEGSAKSLNEVAGKINEKIDGAWHPKQLLEDEQFARGLELIKEQNQSSEDLLVSAFSENKAVACLALEAMKSQADGGPVVQTVLNKLSDLEDWPRYFAFGLLNALEPPPSSLAAKVLSKTNVDYLDPLGLQLLRQFLKDRLCRGDQPDWETELRDFTDERIDSLRALIAGLDCKEALAAADRLKEVIETRINRTLLAANGQVWAGGARPPDIVDHAGLLADASRLESLILGGRRRSVVLVGENGVGKTTLFQVVADRLQEKGWTIFQAGHSELVAGKSYIGEFEQAIKTLVAHLGGRKILWYIPEFHAIAWAGRHQYSPSGALDYILPQVEEARIVVVGETEPSAWENLVQLKPKCRTAFEVVRVPPLLPTETLSVAKQWAERMDRIEDRAPTIQNSALQEGWQLAQQYLGEKSAPGNLLEFLKRARQRAIQALMKTEVSVDDLIAALSVLTGLPQNILDERERLSVDSLRSFFESRVLGQPEAIDCLVDRVSLIKAGLTDPTRPQGVFLFAGPTGTGKTEIAKALAEYLFGSASRMIRLDMSEFQAPGALERLVGEQNQPEQGRALVDLIRKQPFSVVLLDECEKAHFSVWDLFLQVFDDGRLTDRRGSTADFRHAIFILTTNLGAVVRIGESPGFTELGGFSRTAVDRAIVKAFRKEFLNRIDRIVVFQPLSREIMKRILRKELEEVFRRRGLRNRSWAVEWDDVALEFLLEKGFTPDLGARPVRRAIERYLLGPLAKTIVGHQFPEGDQFLFVKSDGARLAVEFVDPDAEPAAVEQQPRLLGSGAPVRDVASIVFQPEGSVEEIARLKAGFEALRVVVEGEEWRQRKIAALSATNSLDFWNSVERFSVLGLAEYLDRIETGMATAGSLLNRLSGARSNRSRYPRDLVQRLAQQIYLLEQALAGIAAGQPRDAFLQVQGTRDIDGNASLIDDSSARLARMYREWAKKRRMQVTIVSETSGSGVSPYQMLLAVSGFGCFTILSPESGLHVFELPRGSSRVGRVKVRVRVAPQPDPPAPEGPDGIRRQAEEALRSAPGLDSCIVRRYRESPSPLVRDTARGWRTGHLDRVLGGDFDIIPRED